MKDVYYKPEIISLDRTDAIRLAAASISGIRNIKTLRRKKNLNEKKKDEVNNKKN